MKKKISTVVEVVSEQDFNRLLPTDAKVVFVAGYKSMEGKELIFGHRKTGADVKLWLVGYSPEQVVFLGIEIREATQDELMEIASKVEGRDDISELYRKLHEDLFQKRIEDTLVRTLQTHLMLTPLVKRIEFRL